MTAREILAIRDPAKLFSADDGQSDYRRLALAWHPDRCRDALATEVFVHIAALWKGRLEPSSSPYLRTRPFELGVFTVSREQTEYELADHHARFLDPLSRCPAFRYANDAMRRECERYLPAAVRVARHIRTVTAYRSPELVLLRDALDYFGGAMEPKAVAWILSSLYSVCCYLQYAGLVHCDISPDTYFIGPEKHWGALASAWWYARAQGEPLDLLPERTVDCAPTRVRVNRRADHSLDLECVKAIGRELLGASIWSAPGAMRLWLQTAASSSAVDDYRIWQGVLKASFGERRFTKMELNPEALYGKKA